MKIKRITGLILILISGIFGWTNTITGAVIGASSSVSFLVVIMFIIGLVLMLEEGEDTGDLERKLKQIESVKVRREILSDAHRAEKFAEKGYDVNGLWDKNKSYDENKKFFFAHFYDDVDEEISAGYYKSILRKKGISPEEFENNKEPHLKGVEYENFRRKALGMITLWNEKVLQSKLIPLFIRESKEEVKDKKFPGTKHRVVYYGPPKLKGKSKSFYIDTGRRSGEIVAAHEIINPEAIEEPEKLNKTPHIHWELEYIMREGYKVN